MKKIILSAALIACAAVNGARAATNAALGCLQTSALSGGLSGCLNEPGKDASVPVPAGAMAARPETTPSLSAASLDSGKKKRSNIVPTPTGYTTAVDGSLKAGFFNGLDSGFKAVFMGFVGLPVLGLQAFGAPNSTNAGTIACLALGVLLSIPGSIVGAVVGAPLGAVAGMISEKASPGSTKDWFTF